MTILLLTQPSPANVTSDFTEVFGITDSAEKLDFTESLTAADLWSYTVKSILDFSDSISSVTDVYSYSLYNGAIDCEFGSFGFNSTAISDNYGDISCLSNPCSSVIEALNSTSASLDVSAKCSFSCSAVVGIIGNLVCENSKSLADFEAILDSSTIPVASGITCKNGISTFQASGILSPIGSIDAVLYDSSSFNSVAIQSQLCNLSAYFGDYSFSSYSNENNVAFMSISCNSNLALLACINPTATLSAYNRNIVLEGISNAEYF